MGREQEVKKSLNFGWRRREITHLEIPRQADRHKDSQQEKVQITIQECCIKTCQQAVTKPKHGSSDGRAADYNPKAPGSSLCSGS